MQAHVSKTTQTCFFHLRRLRQVRRLLGRDVTANLVAAFVLSRLDYGNALLVGLPYTTIAWPTQTWVGHDHSATATSHQRRSQTGLLYGLRARDHVTAAAIELHLLPIEARIQYKICSLVHLSLNGKAPSYVSSLLKPVFTPVSYTHLTLPTKRIV